MSAFKEINPKEIVESPFKLIGDDWSLVTASAEIYICVYGERRPLYNELF